MRTHLLLLTLSILLIDAHSVLAQWHGSDAPDSLSFQGYLTDDLGGPINGPTDITFKLYKGGAQVWAETETDVPVVNGVFNVFLGGPGGVSLDGVPFDLPMELGITVESDAEIVPRTPLTSSPYALGMRGMSTFLADDGFNVATNVIGGSSNNFVGSGVAGATIGGGGGDANGSIKADSVTADWGTVGGGANNRVDGAYGTIAGGQLNRAGAFAATVAGGSANHADGFSSAVVGGTNNSAGATWSFIGGGTNNQATNDYATIAGGEANGATALHSTVSGGKLNTATDTYATVGGGVENDATQYATTVSGGDLNVASGGRASVGGGRKNVASGFYSAIPGGEENAARGWASFAAGYKARANHHGTFVWNDRSLTTGNDSLLSTGDNQFIVRADGGVGINTNAPLNELHVVGSHSGSASVPNHVAVIDNISTGTSADVLALRIGRSSAPDTVNSFITFIYNSGVGAGFIRGNGSGGVELVSLGSDYAEYLPHRNPEETLDPGDVVGMFSGRITQRTEGADQIMVISTAPIVVGNHPVAKRGEPAEHSRVAFIGQAPVNVRGSVDEGDFLVPSGRSDGTAVAVDPADVSVDQLGLVFATAWEGKSDPGVGKVNAAIGIDQAAASKKVIEALQERVSDMDERLAALERRMMP